MAIPKINLKDLTFLIPVRIDSIERLENLLVVTNFLMENLDTHICVLEAFSRNTGILHTLLHPDIEHMFIQDEHPIFHRTHYLNVLTRKATTPYIAIWDSDAMVFPEQILRSVEHLRKKTAPFVFPYDGRFLDTTQPVRDLYCASKNAEDLKNNISRMYPYFGWGACGGGFLADKEIYCSAGMENENFFGWGIEDGERVKRWEILNLEFVRISGPMFHLTHPRGINSKFASDEQQTRSMQEYIKICSLSTEEMQAYVASWEHMKISYIKNIV